MSIKDDFIKSMNCKPYDDTHSSICINNYNCDICYIDYLKSIVAKARSQNEIDQSNIRVLAKELEEANMEVERQQWINVKDRLPDISEEKKMNKHIETLIQLSKENPDLEIITMTDYEVCCSDDYQYWKGEIESVEKDIYWEYDGGECYIIGKSNILEKIKYNTEDEPKYENFDDDEIKIVINNEFERLKNTDEIKEAIFIFIGV